MEKYNHLALVRREEVIELFKNGLIYPISSILFDEDLELLPSNTKEVEKVFSKTPVIDYSINYFLLYAETDKKSSLSCTGLDVNDLISIIPLDEESARMGLPLEPAIKLYQPIFEANFLDYQENSAVENARKGIQNIAKIFGFTKVELWKSIKKLTEQKGLRQLVSLIIDENETRQPETIWEFLLCYNRSQTFPNDKRGAFLDTISVVRNWRERCVCLKDMMQYNICRAILMQQNFTYESLTKCLKESRNFIKTANNAYKDFWRIAPLYFILLDYFSNISEDGMKVKTVSVTEFIENVKTKNDVKYLKPALLMLGITLGQSSTYKVLYAVKKDEFHFLL